jgi:hypothetical protein
VPDAPRGDHLPSAKTRTIVAGVGDCYLALMQGFSHGMPRRVAVVVLDDRARLPWRFLARHISIDGLSGG